MNLPTLSAVDDEVRRREGPEPLSFLPDAEFEEFAALVEQFGPGVSVEEIVAGEGRVARQAARLWRRAEARLRHNVVPSYRRPGWMVHPLDRLPGVDECVAVPCGPAPDGCRCVHWVLDRGGGPGDFWPAHLRRENVREFRRLRRETPDPPRGQETPGPVVDVEPGPVVDETGPVEPRRARRRRGASVSLPPLVGFPEAEDVWDRMARAGLRIIDGGGR